MHLPTVRELIDGQQPVRVTVGAGITVASHNRRPASLWLNGFVATFREPYSGTRRGLVVLGAIKRKCFGGFLTHSRAKLPALRALRLAGRRPPRVGAHPERPRRTRTRHALPDLDRRTGATVEAVIPKGPEWRLRLVSHPSQFIRRHPPWIAPDRITVGPDFGPYIDLRLGRLGHVESPGL
jgi:hypothetical protein